jgi:hypothetical protein
LGGIELLGFWLLDLELEFNEGYCGNWMRPRDKVIKRVSVMIRVFICLKEEKREEERERMSREQFPFSMQQLH